MTALTPVYTIGWQIAEQVMTHNQVSKSAAGQRAWISSPRSALPIRPPLSTAIPRALGRHAPARRHRHGALLQSSLLIADEPTTALDVTVQAQILDLA
jgi:peptide/nickel transport system ATP-binding protein